VKRSPDNDPSVILTRTNVLLFVVVVLLGALIIAQMCLVTLLFASPALRERIYGPPPTRPAPTRTTGEGDGVGWGACEGGEGFDRLGLVTNSGVRRQSVAWSAQPDRFAVHLACF
jgi:hypothetical protein